MMIIAEHLIFSLFRLRYKSKEMRKEILFAFDFGRPRTNRTHVCFSHPRSIISTF